jgi:hypothetical protein
MSIDGVRHMDSDEKMFADIDAREQEQVLASVISRGCSDLMVPLVPPYPLSLPVEKKQTAYSKIYYAS